MLFWSFGCRYLAFSRKPVNKLPNSALVSDACAAALRAYSSAPQRER